MGYEYPHKEKEVYIISNSEIKKPPNFNTYKGDLSMLINCLKGKKVKINYCDGGSDIVTQLLEKI